MFYIFPYKSNVKTTDLYTLVFMLLDSRREDGNFEMNSSESKTMLAYTNKTTRRNPAKARNIKQWKEVRFYRNQ